MVRIGLPNRISNHLSSRGGGASTDHSRSGSPARQGSVGDSKPLILKVNVIKGRNLAAKDKGGTSDPYLVVTLGNAKQSTPTINKTLNPEWKTCLDMPLTDMPLVECICWDRDRFGKDYMGEFDVAVEDIFANGQLHQEPKWYTLKSRRKGGKKSSEVSGEVQIQFSLVDAANPAASPEDIYHKFRSTILAADADSEDNMSRLPSHDTNGDDDTDNELDDEEALEDTGKDEETSDETEDQAKPELSEKKKRKKKLKMLRRKSRAIRAYEFTGKDSDVSGIIFLEIGKITDLPPEKNMTRTSFDVDPFVVTALGRKVMRTKVVRHNLNPVYNEKMVLQVMRHETAYSIYFSVMDRDTLTGNDFIASTNFPVQRLVAAAPEADPNTGLYKLQEPVESSPPPPKENKSRFRLPLSRSASSSSLSKLTRPPLRSNNSQTSLSSSSQLDVQDRQATNLAPTSAPSEPSLIARVNSNSEGEASRQSPEDPDMQPLIIPLTLKNKERWEDKHFPELYITAKYLPYRALRQQFWRAMLKQYDADDSGRVSKIELTTLLDTLGSTLKESTIDSFFHRFAAENESADSLDLTFDQAVICLEEQLLKATQKASFGQRLKGLGHHAREATLTNGGDQNGAKAESMNHDSTNVESERAALPVIEQDHIGELGEDGSLINEDDLAEEGGEEHVIEIRECPLCHQPRMGKRTDADIITHIATCASSDWRQVNNLVMGGFVTSSQAQRKWYSKVITKISYGGYKLGANSANILVQDRMTGQINEERMSVYVRLGIRLLYKALGSREMEKKRIRKMLRSLSYKQGKKYDDPASASQIEAFIAFHQLDMSEVLFPLEQFKNFNEFFYRALKRDARPCSAPDDPKVIVSPADCRTVVFDKMEDATRIWVKGRDYSVEKLLGDAYPLDAKRYKNGALGIFRLAPQDYHRFHIPVDGVLGTPKLIEGEYYTVNPMAIRSALDVYGENVRVVVPIDSVAHGRVMYICVGAMMVGSTVITRKAGEKVKRAEELGYFKFGGSTILLLFEPGSMKFDDDLVENSKGALETLVRVGMSIGHHPMSGAYTPDMKKDEENITMEDRQEAKRRIEGSLAAEAS